MLDTLHNRDHRSPAAVVLALALLVAACSGAGQQDVSSDSSSTTKSSATSPTTSSATTDLPTTEATTEQDNSASTDVAARRQLDWVVGLLNRDDPPTAADMSERFSPAFLAQIPAEQLVAGISQISAVAEPPYVVESFEPAADGVSAQAALLGADGNRLDVQIVVGVSEPNLIEGIQFLPLDLEFPTPISVDAIDERLTALASQSSLGVYQVSGGTCDPIHEIRTDANIVLGSIFKLWVLAALAHEIDQGTASWDETVPVTDELRSSPDGEIYELSTGTEVTLQELAEAMISISDNTATDLLIDRLGRDRVEAAVERAGVANPEANIPMLSTGNLFALKFVPEPPNTDDYQALDEAGKRSLLEDLDDAVLSWVDSDVSLEELAAIVNADGVALDQPRDLDLEWFATAGDICRTMVHLYELADIAGLEPVASILEINPGGGIPFDRDQWPTIGFKGGSEPGVVAGAWRLEGPEGDAYVIAGGVANPDNPVNDLDVALLLASASELIE